MKTLLTLTAAAVLATGCALPVWKDAQGNEVSPQHFAECDYEGIKATASTNNAALAGWNRAEVRLACLRAKGYAPQRGQK